MFSICPKKVYQNKDLTAIDIRVYITIQGFANAQGYCFPSIRRIADICGVCRRTIERSLSRLEKANVLARRKHIAENGGYTSNDYYLNLAPDDVTNPQIDDTTNESQGVQQRSRIGCAKNVASNNIAIEQDYYVNNNIRARNARSGAENGAEISNESKPVLEMEDLNDVLSCLEAIKPAAEYRFFKLKGGVIGCKPSWALAENKDTEKDIQRYFDYTIKREIVIMRHNENALNAIEIKIGG